MTTDEVIEVLLAACEQAWQAMCDNCHAKYATGEFCPGHCEAVIALSAAISEAKGTW